MPYIFEKKYPKLYSELHPILNKGLDLVKLKYTSNKLIWWKCSKQRCGHDWKDTLASRIKDNECPKCKLRKKNWLTSEEVKIINNFKKIKDFENKIDKMLDFVFDENSTSNLRLLKIGNINKLLSKIKAVNKDTKKVFICYRESRLKENKEIKISKNEKELEKENKIKEKKAKKFGI